MHPNKSPLHAQKVAPANRNRGVHQIFHRQETRGRTKTVERDPVSVISNARALDGTTF